MANEADRLQLISRVEEARGGRVLSLVLGDRRGHETRFAGDLLPIMYEHLSGFGHVQEIALFLYTPGGDTLAAWGMVNLIREYCDRFTAIVPFRCLSAGTLVVLGADQILLAPGAQLGPIDPSVSSPHNPPAPGAPQPGRVSLLPVSVEDVVGFLHLAQSEGGIRSEEPMAKVFASLADKVHPLALGAVYRAREHVDSLARSLLKSHIDDDTRVQGIIDYLGKLPSHQYLISRKEARGVFGDDLVVPIPEELEREVWDLYRAYQDWLELTTPYSPEAVLGADQSKTVTFPRAAFESRDGNELRSHVYRTIKELKRVQMAQPGVSSPVMGIQETTIAEGWTAWPESGG